MTTRLFNNEPDFEEALVAVLQNKGWGDMPVLYYPTENELIRNWADRLYETNNDIDCLNGCPLTDSEMQQILQQVADLRTPLNINKFVNGKTVTITRDNPSDTLHLGKNVSLKIYDRQQIAGGQSTYQIVRQPKFNRQIPGFGDRRGDLMLLINGMPLIHIELKKSGVPVFNATNQIERYMQEGIFTGVYSMIQVFVAMNPEETLYFANPGPDGKFNRNFFFHWADFNNELINDWQEIAETLLSIPMAHQLIGFYTVPDTGDNILKVMRSYQYYAVNRISRVVQDRNWKVPNQLGGFVWHTTGSGKTLTSFKSAQLLAQQSNLIDKVVFLVDRIELGTQSYEEYKGFADDDSVQDTKNTGILINKLKSDDPNECLIVTSIQKMSNISEDKMRGREAELEMIRKKKIVFIIDEAHRSVFGDMYPTIRNTFPMSLIFGFTGTPIFEENQRNLNYTATLFGEELHRYTMPDGIRDKNVKGFNPIQVRTYKDRDLREAIALEKAKSSTIEEAYADEKKKEVFLHYMNEVPMAGYKSADDAYNSGIEDYIDSIQYETPEHCETVVKDILDNFTMLSIGGKYHAIFATSSIPEAISYFRMLRQKAPNLKVACLFDPSIDENGGGFDKEKALKEIIDGYNERYGTNYELPTFPVLKKDLSNRLAHKGTHKFIASTPSKQIDLLIVVDQMLTGFDSKWVNTLYLDKVLKHEGLIQAFSRTNRPCDDDKPHGTIRYYRKVNTMKRNIDIAIGEYSGDRPLEVYVNKLPFNLRKMNEIYAEIKELFENAGIPDMARLPENDADKGRFSKLFKKFNDHLQAARLQEFKWDKLVYSFDDDMEYVVCFTREDYDIMIARYNELIVGGSESHIPNIPYDIDPHLTEIETGRIDYDYMNSRFEKYIKAIDEGLDSDRLQRVLDELHKSYASLSQEEQLYASQFLHDYQSGEAHLNVCKSFHDYIVDYKNKAQEGKIQKIAISFGLDEQLLKEMAEAHLTEATLDSFGRYTRLKSTVNKILARAYFESKTGERLSMPKLNMKLDETLRRFILKGVFE